MEKIKEQLASTESSFKENLKELYDCNEIKLLVESMGDPKKYSLLIRQHLQEEEEKLKIYR